MSVKTDICPCGIAKGDCEYHKEPLPEQEQKTVRTTYTTTRRERLRQSIQDFCEKYYSTYHKKKSPT